MSFEFLFGALSSLPSLSHIGFPALLVLPVCCIAGAIIHASLAQIVIMGLFFC